MASRRGAPAGAGASSPSPQQEAAPGIVEPTPGLHITLRALEAGTVLHRVHRNQYEPAQFNPGTAGNARFSPIRNQSGDTIPTLYAGTTLQCALMETVFHDVPYSGALKTVNKSKLVDQVHSTVTLARQLQLVDLSTIALRKLGVQRNQLIDTEKDQYPNTRRWAEAIHAQCLEAQGLMWVSRQDDQSRAVVLFGDRVPDDALKPTGNSHGLVHHRPTYEQVLLLAQSIGADVVMATP